jgi:hypothetical protein
MKYFSLTFLLVTLLFAATSASAQTDATTQAIMQLENSLDDALLKGDAAALDKLIANDWFVKSESTAITTKAQLVGYMKSNGSPWAAIKDHDVTVRIYDSAAVVDGYSSRKLKANETPVNFRFTRVYAKSATGWQLVAMHAEKINQQ